MPRDTLVERQREKAQERLKQPGGTAAPPTFPTPSSDASTPPPPAGLVHPPGRHAMASSSPVALFPPRARGSKTPPPTPPPPALVPPLTFPSPAPVPVRPTNFGPMAPSGAPMGARYPWSPYVNEPFLPPREEFQAPPPTTFASPMAHLAATGQWPAGAGINWNNPSLIGHAYGPHVGALSAPGPGGQTAGFNPVPAHWAQGVPASWSGSGFGPSTEGPNIGALSAPGPTAPANPHLVGPPHFYGGR